MSYTHAIRARGSRVSFTYSNGRFDKRCRFFSLQRPSSHACTAAATAACARLWILSENYI